MAIGLGHFDRVPPVLAGLPDQFVTHSSRHSTLEHFQGRELAVVGAGASALDLAALLHQAGAAVHVVARDSVIRFHDPPEIPRALWKRMRFPMTGIGSGWKPLFCATAPSLFRQLPERFRLHVVDRLLGPAPAWFIKDETVGHVRFHLGASVSGAAVDDHRVHVRLRDKAGVESTLHVDHVIAATGYKVDVRRLAFLDAELLAGIRRVDQAPALSANFESSVPGLYFVGTASANTFGPLMRFVYGTDFTARRLTRHLAPKYVASSVSGSVIDRANGGLTR